MDEKTNTNSGSTGTLTALLAVCLVVSVLVNGFQLMEISNLSGKLKGMQATDPIKTSTTIASSGSSTTVPIVATTIESADSPATTIKASTGGLNIIVLNDERCADCDVSSLLSSLMGVFPTASFQELDYNSEEGKKLYSESGIKLLPAVLFGDDVKTSDGYPQVQNYLENAGDYLSLRIGAQFDPSAEICDNGIDDDANGEVDCADAYCKDRLVCREEKKNNLQLFIMSDCPYGRMAIEALKEVVDNLDESLVWNVHYIANANSDGSFSSLHGQYEVDEDIIQLCVKKHSPEAFLDYLYCRSPSSIKGVDWKTCATDNGVDADAVAECFAGDEGKALLAEDIKIAEALNVGGSPTWLANNRYEFGGIDAETVRTNICKYNPDLGGCDQTLSSDTSGISGGCGA